MTIGFIGAGKVGCSLGKYFTMHNILVTGYYSKSSESAAQAAKFTGTDQYTEIESLVRNCDTLFLTVPDMEISEVWEQLKVLPIQKMKICHCSGALSASIFSGADCIGAYGYSIHPLYAVSSKYDSYRGLSNTIFTIEGDAFFLEEFCSLFEQCGNKVQIINEENKAKYHASAVVASNLITGLISVSYKMLLECGFLEQNAEQALAPLIKDNVESVLREGFVSALTGPVERNDSSTVKKHLDCLNDDDKEIYRLLSKKVLDIAEKKHEGTDFQILEELLK